MWRRAAVVALGLVARGSIDPAGSACTCEAVSSCQQARAIGGWAYTGDTVATWPKRGGPLPLEMARVRNGVVAFERGISFNEGLSRWLIVDFDRQVLIDIHVQKPPWLEKRGPEAELAKHRRGRTSSASGTRPLESVALVALEDAALRHVRCLASTLAIYQGHIHAPSEKSDFVSDPLRLIVGGVVTEAGGDAVSWPLQRALQQEMEGLSDRRQQGSPSR